MPPPAGQKEVRTKQQVGVNSCKVLMALWGLHFILKAKEDLKLFLAAFLVFRLESVFSTLLFLVAHSSGLQGLPSFKVLLLLILCKLQEIISNHLETDVFKIPQGSLCPGPLSLVFNPLV